jgi:hypothetical protein
VLFDVDVREMGHARSDSKKVSVTARLLPLPVNGSTQGGGERQALTASARDVYGERRNGRHRRNDRNDFYGRTGVASSHRRDLHDQGGKRHEAESDGDAKPTARDFRGGLFR